MLKVSRARVYLHKLASVAKVVQLSRMMEKDAANPPKPNSGVDVRKGVNQDPVNKQKINAAPGGGGTLKNTTGPGNANSAVKGVGAGSPLNAARAEYADSGASKLSVKPFFQNPVATNTLYDNRIDFWNQNTWVPRYNQQGVMVDADGKAAKKNQYPVTSYQDFAAANSGNGYVYDSANAASGFGITNYINPKKNSNVAGYANENENIIHLRPGNDSATHPSVPHHEGTHIKTFGLDYMAGQPYPHMYNSLDPPERYGVAGNHSAIPGAVSDEIRTMMQQNQTPINSGKGIIQNDKQYGGVYRIPYSLNEAEAASTYAEIGYAQQNPNSGYYPAYRNELRPDPRLNPNAQVASLPPAPYKEPTQEERLRASLGGAGVASMLGGGGMMATSGPELPSAEFTPATPLGYMLEADGTNSMGERYGVYGGPKKTKNGYEFNDNLLRMGYNVNDTQDAYTDATMDPGSHFARLEALQHQFDPAYAQFRPIGVAPGSKEYQEMGQSPYTVQELMAMATSGSPELYEEASKYAHMLRPELRYLMQTNDAATMRAAYNDKDNKSMNSVRSIMNADPRYMAAPQALQIPYSVSPGVDKLTDHRSNATMDNMFDDIAYQNIRRDELLKEMNHSDTLDASGLFNPYYDPENSLGGSPYELDENTTLEEFNKMREERDPVNRAIARAEKEKGEPLTEEEKEQIRNDYAPLPWFDLSQEGERAYDEDTQALPAPVEEREPSSRGIGNNHNQAPQSIPPGMMEAMGDRANPSYGPSETEAPASSGAGSAGHASESSTLPPYEENPEALSSRGGSLEGWDQVQGSQAQVGTRESKTDGSKGISNPHTPKQSPEEDDSMPGWTPEGMDNPYPPEWSPEGMNNPYLPERSPEEDNSMPGWEPEGIDNPYAPKQSPEEDENMPGWTPEGLGEQNDFPALHQRDYRDTGASSWTTMGDKMQPSTGSLVAPTNPSMTPSVAPSSETSTTPPTVAPSAPPVSPTTGMSEQRTYDSGDQQYTQQELDELLQNNDWRDQLDVLNGNALVYALEQGIGNSFDENWDTNPQSAVDYFKAGILSYAQREGKITDEQAEYLSNAADAYLESRRGGASRPEPEEYDFSATGSRSSVDRNLSERGGFNPKSDDYHGDEYMPWGQAAAEEREPSADEMMALEEERIQREQDYPVPGEAESTDDQKQKRQGRYSNAFGLSKKKMQRMKEDAEKIRKDPKAEHIQNTDESWTHRGTITNGSVSSTGSGSSDLHAKALPESSKSWTPSSGGYAPDDGKTWTDDEIRSIGSPEEQFNALSGDALERAMAMNMESGFKSSGLIAKTVDYAMQAYDELLGKAESMGKLSSEHTARLRQRFRNYLWNIKPKQMYESNVARGLKTSKKHMARLREWEQERAMRRGDIVATTDNVSLEKRQNGRKGGGSSKPVTQVSNAVRRGLHSSSAVRAGGQRVVQQPEHGYGKEFEDFIHAPYTDEEQRRVDNAKYSWQKPGIQRRIRFEREMAFRKAHNIPDDWAPIDIVAGKRAGDKMRSDMADGSIIQEYDMD